MKKVHFLLLFAIIFVCYSGKPVSKYHATANCGAHISVDAMFPVSQIMVSNMTMGTTYTINNPSLPYTFNDPGYDMMITVIFNGYYSGSAFVHDIAYQNPIYCTNFQQNDYVMVLFQGFCSEYDINIWDDSVGPCAN